MANMLSESKFSAAQGCIVAGMSIRETCKYTGVAKHTVMKISQGNSPRRHPNSTSARGGKKGAAQERYFETLVNRNPPDENGNPTCVENESLSLVRDRRILALSIAGHEKRRGETPDARCGNPRCYAPEHVYFRPLKSYKESPWKDLARRIELLGIDEEIELADFPHKSEKERTKLRCNIMVHTLARFAIRSQPAGGIKIIRVGTYGSIYAGTKEEFSSTVHPVLIYRRGKPSNTIGSVFLGQFWGTWDIPREDRTGRVEHCSEKGCPFPRMDGATVCRTHRDWDSALVSYPREQKLDYQHDAFARAGDDRSVGSGKLDALLHSGWIDEDKYNFMHTTTHTNNGGYVQRSKAERENDKWWKENVVDKGIEAPGVTVRKTRAELKAEMDTMIDHSLQTYSAYQSDENVKAFWRVSKEKKQLHDDPIQFRCSEVEDR